MKRLFAFLFSLIAMLAMTSYSNASSSVHKSSCVFTQLLDVGNQVQATAIIYTFISSGDIVIQINQSVTYSMCNQTFKAYLAGYTQRDVGWSYHYYKIILDPENNKAMVGDNYRNVAHYFCQLT